MGLYLRVRCACGKLRHVQDQIAGQEKLPALGSYPDVPRAAARFRCDAAHRLWQALQARGYDAFHRWRDDLLDAAKNNFN